MRGIDQGAVPLGRLFLYEGGSMSDWLLRLPVAGMSVVILGAIYLFTAAVYLVVSRLAVGERQRAFETISPGMLPPLSVVFALLVGFLAAQVWSDTDRANTAVNREASALRVVRSGWQSHSRPRGRGMPRLNARSSARSRPRSMPAASASS